ncbi:MAG: hypothetical protein A3C82_00995 [Candidatus Wildermuthbacteria bacterium RIFCSPHIGHO2_02_FULL_47_12]|uniref:Uncharacterized protein n=1 Tax=Candidatus Wildermuthbacteria bacterium RIFCSPHIGHO2_02_FULL_47_12 TaxID=1802451 RepID=A0A1G2R2M2_9BACT|nr:MAG: hypothetical protein A3C82_00995 [Candidatus Wildermuthbacteria bacterium RIFCSPHIGHO2_02_FULL_47_12]
MKRISWKILWQTIMRLPAFGAQHAFPFTLLLIAIAGILSLLLFAIYGFSSQTKYVGQEASLYDVKEELFLDLVAELEKRELGLENMGGETARDIFYSIQLTEE